jgi:transposase
MSTKRQKWNQVKPVTRRTFSEGFKLKKVREILQQQTTVLEVSRQYGVTRTNVYRWLTRYSSDREKGVRLIMETDSDTRKLHEQQKRIAELERAVGQKQLELDFLLKVIELAEQTYEVDIKKKFGDKPWSGTGKTGNDLAGA